MARSQRRSPILALTLAAAGLLLLAPSQARAEGTGDPPTAYRFTAGIFGGVHLYDSEHNLGRFEDDPPELSPDHGFAFGGRLALHLFSWLSLEGELLASPTQTRNGATSLWVSAYRGSVLFHILSEGRVQPFVLGGFGALVSVVYDNDVMEDDADPALHLGIGARFPLYDRFGLRFDARVMTPPAIFSGIVEATDETGFHGPDFELLLAIEVSFGAIAGEPTPAADPAPKPADPPKPPPPPPPPPPAPEPPPPVLRFDPPTDNVAASSPDLDGDGILGSADACPESAEDVDGFQDDDGCPDPDNDRDGVLDAADRCPEEAETPNGYQDEDGCADEVPAALRPFAGVIESIRFQPNRNTLLRSSYVILEQAVIMLKENPEIRLEIGGHTDSIGPMEKNLALSQDRADAVKAYFVKNGVAADRLVAIGYGEHRSTASNETKKGRAMNRRIEFKIISPGR